MSEAAVTSQLMPALEGALDCARLGWPVFPVWGIRNGRCECPNRTCESPGKHPRHRDWEESATTEERIIRSWAEWWPHGNFGLRTGVVVDVIDIDPRHGGDEEFARLEAEHGAVETVRVISGGGGIHNIVRSDPTAHSRNGVRPGVDVKAAGGLVVAVGSLHVSGRRYEWDAGAHPDETDLAPFPTWLTGLLGANGHGKKAAAPLPEVINRDRNSTLTSLAGSMRRRGCSEEAILAALRTENDARCRPPLGDAEVRKIAASVAQYDPATVEVRESFHLTDLGNAKRFVARHGQDVRYCHPLKTWFAWSGKRWESDETGEVVRRAKETALSIYEEAVAETNEDRRKALAKHAVTSEKAERIAATLKLAQSEPGIPIDPGALDADPWLLNVANGTIDLRTGDLRPHRREDLLTKLSPVAFDPSAHCELWSRFLERAVPDEEARRFLQKAAGYTLTGLTGEDVLLVIHGPTRTGKGTQQDAFAGALGDYATTAEIDLVAERDKTGGARPELMALRGARMVNIYETSSRLRLSASLVKSLAGSDPIRARDLYAKPIEFRPVAKIWLATNHRPKVPDDDAALWERIRELPFNVQIPPEERDLNVRAWLRDPERGGPAVLAWALEGCLAWQREGLGRPRVVDEATRAYRDEMDPLADFIASCCVLAEGAWTPAGVLRAEYEKWAKETGTRPLQGKQFGERLRKLGCEAERQHAGRGWRGIGLLTTEGVTP